VAMVAEENEAHVWHGWCAAGVVAASAAPLRGGWRAKTATTWLDRATTLECSGGEVTGWQDGRDGMAASALGGIEAGRGSDMH
jgi:hypothetical protein